MPDLTIGQTFTGTKRFSQAEFDQFARLSGDDNPIHVDPAFAGRTDFGRTVAHGMHLYSMICGLLGRTFPGAVQLSQQFMFPAPTFAGEDMTITLSVLETRPAAAQVRLSTTITNPAGTVTCTGETVLAWR